MAAVARYRRAMRRLAGMGEVEAWQSPAEVDDLKKRYHAILSWRERRLADADLARARDRAGLHSLDKLICPATGRGGRKTASSGFAADPPLLVPVADLPDAEASGLEAHLNGIIANYRRTLEWDRRFLIGKYQVADMARKVVGIGSVGMRCWVILLTGRDPEDRLFLQVKEAVPSVLSRVRRGQPVPEPGRARGRGPAADAGGQ